MDVSDERDSQHRSQARPGLAQLTAPRGGRGGRARAATHLGDGREADRRRGRQVLGPVLHHALEPRRLFEEAPTRVLVFGVDELVDEPAGRLQLCDVGVQLEHDLVDVARKRGAPVGPVGVACTARGVVVHTAQVRGPLSMTTSLDTRSGVDAVCAYRPGNPIHHARARPAGCIRR